jgi:GDP/UDP-N,N'-diacetylbacillosamine 2-epimerase (hydrolysing)
MKKIRVCVVTGSRAEYGLFFPILRKIQLSNALSLQIIASSMHFSTEFGNTYEEIENDGFFIDEKIENLIASDSETSVAKSTGLATILISDAFDRLDPDVVLLLGDRYETHAAATSAMLMNIPIAHIHGGEITEGAIDEKIRHSITKMSSIHFTSTQEYKERVIQMGELPTMVHNVGAPGIDNICNMDLLSKEDLETQLGWKIKKPTALFTYHSETLSQEKSEVQIKQILDILKKSRLNIIFTYANADFGGSAINKQIENFVLFDRKKYFVSKSLGQKIYLSAMKHLDLLIGNSSSGIIESASFHKPVVNIGNRQLGRLQSGNIIDSSINNLLESILKANSNKFINHCQTIKNVYGLGNSASKIVELLEKTDLKSIKKFHDL